MPTQAGIAKFFLLMLEYYPNTKIKPSDEKLINLWGVVLQGVSDRDLQRGLVEYVRAGNKFAPQAADMAGICIKASLQLGSYDESAWLHEWARSEDGCAAHTLAVESYPNVYANLHGTFAKCKGCPNNPNEVIGRNAARTIEEV